MCDEKLAVLLVLGICGCSCIDSGRWVFHKDGSYGPWWWRPKYSQPAYPPEIGKEPATWYEGGKIWHIP